MSNERRLAEVVGNSVMTKVAGSNNTGVFRGKMRFFGNSRRSNLAEKIVFFGNSGRGDLAVIRGGEVRAREEKNL